MFRLCRTALFCIAFALPSLTHAQTVFDVSGNIQSAGFSGALTLTPTNVGDTVLASNWDISVPAIPLSNGGSLSAFIFTPANSTVSSQTQQNDLGTFTLISLYSAQTQTTLQLDMYSVFSTEPNQGSVSIFFNPQNGVTYATGSVTLTPVPESPSGILVATGLAGLAVLRRRLFKRVPAFHS